MCEYICNIQINTLATYVRKNRWNIGNKILQHTCTTIATYATSWFTFATSIWNTCNIPLITSKTLETYICNIGGWRGQGRLIPASEWESAPSGRSILIYQVWKDWESLESSFSLILPKKIKIRSGLWKLLEMLLRRIERFGQIWYKFW